MPHSLAMMARMEKCYWNLHDKLVRDVEQGESVEESAERTLKYLARYVRRTAIANSRLISLENDMVSFSYKDYRDDGKVKVARLHALEFIDRFLQHVMPRGRRQVRNYGFLSPNKRTEKLKLLREIFNLRARADLEEEEEHEGGDALSHGDEEAPTARICSSCEVGLMVLQREMPRPRVSEIMAWTTDDMRQLKLDFR